VFYHFIIVVQAERLGVDPFIERPCEVLKQIQFRVSDNVLHCTGDAGASTHSVFLGQEFLQNTGAILHLFGKFSGFASFRVMFLEKDKRPLYKKKTVVV